MKDVSYALKLAEDTGVDALVLTHTRTAGHLADVVRAALVGSLEERAELQGRIDALAGRAAAGTVEDRVACSKEAFAEAAESYRQWARLVEAQAPRRPGLTPYDLAWRRFDRSCGRAPTPTPR